MPDLTTQQAAERLAVSLNTLLKMADSGDLPCYRTRGGHRRFRETDVDEILALRETGEVAHADLKAAAWTRAALAVLDGAERDLGKTVAAARFSEAARVLRLRRAAR